MPVTVDSQGSSGGAVVLPSNSVAYLSLAIDDSGTPGNNPVTGATVVAAIRRESDGAWWDFSASEWDVVADYASLGPEHLQTLDDNIDSTYSKAWDHATADPAAQDAYSVVYQVTAGVGWVNRWAQETLVFEDVALDVWERDLAAYEATMAAGTKAGEVAMSLRSAQVGRMGISSGTMTTYRADGTTPGLVYTLLSNKTGRGAPAQGS